MSIAMHLLIGRSYNAMDVWRECWVQKGAKHVFAYSFWSETFLFDMHCSQPNMTKPFGMVDSSNFWNYAVRYTYYTHGINTNIRFSRRPNPLDPLRITRNTKPQFMEGTQEGKNTRSNTSLGGRHCGHLRWNISLRTFQDIPSSKVMDFVAKFLFESVLL